MTRDRADHIHQIAFRDGGHCWSCMHCHHVRELDVDRPEGDHLRYAYFRHCNATDPFACPAVADEVRHA